MKLKLNGMKLKPSALGAVCMMLQPIFLNLLSIPATAYIIRGLGALGYGQWMVGVSLVAAMTFLTKKIKWSRLNCLLPRMH